MSEKSSRRTFRQDDARNEKTRNDEEHIDAGEAAGDQRAIGVEGDHAEHRKRAQSVDVPPEVEAAAGARGGDVLSVEGFVQERVLPPSRRDAPEGVELSLAG